MAKSASEFGPRVRLEAGAIQLAISKDPPLPIHPRYWAELGVEVRKADLLVQKNFFHYRIFYAAMSFEHVPVASRGATNLRRVTELPLRVPSRPQANLADWRAGDQLLRA
jgi:microcystin degradation protein MlrC